MRELNKSEQLLVAGGVATGLNSGVDNIANASPLMASEISQIQGQGWHIVYASGSKSYTDPSTHTINISQDYEARDMDAASQLTHELGHALRDNYQWNPTNSSQEKYVESMMDNEGAAQYNSVRIAEELVGKGIQISIAGSFEHVQQEIEIIHRYDTLWDVPGQNKISLQYNLEYAVGQSMYDEQLSGGVTYAQYYSDWYNQHHSDAPLTRNQVPAGGGADTGLGYSPAKGDTFIVIPYTGGSLGGYATVLPLKQN